MEKKFTDSIFIPLLEEIAQDEKVTLGELSQKLSTQGPAFICLISVIPFMQPIPLPGISTLLGFVIALQGVSLIFFQTPYLTERMKKATIPLKRYQQFIVLLKKLYPFIHWMFLLNRSQAQGTYVTQAKLSEFRLVRISVGLLIIILAIGLSLPLPIPTSNFIPAVGIFFLALGMLEKKNSLLLIGLIYSVSLLFFLVLSFQFLAAEWSAFF